MPATYSTTVKSSRMTAVRDAIDGGSGAGQLQIGTTNMSTILITYILDDPCGTVSNGVLTFSSFPKTVAASNSGTAAAARIVDSNATVIVSGLTVGTSGTDVVLSSVSIIGSNNVTINLASITHAT